MEVNDEVVEAYELGFQLTALIADIVKYTMIVIGSLMVLLGTIGLTRTLTSQVSVDPEGWRGMQCNASHYFDKRGYSIQSSLSKMMRA